MPDLRNDFEGAENPISHFIAVDAAQLVLMQGEQHYVTQANVHAYNQLWTLAGSSNRIEIIALDDREATLVKHVLAGFAEKYGPAPLQTTVKTLESVEEGYYSAFVTDRPEAFAGKLSAYSTINMPDKGFQRILSR